MGPDPFLVWCSRWRAAGYPAPYKDGHAARVILLRRIARNLRGVR